MGKRRPETRRTINAKYRHLNREKINQKSRDEKVRLKLEVLERYGKCCSTCGYSDIRALQIDHINNNGSEERRKLGGQNFSGHSFYRFLKSQNYPEGYQTLCANCNLIKHIEFKEEHRRNLSTGS